MTQKIQHEALDPRDVVEDLPPPDPAAPNPTLQARIEALLWQHVTDIGAGRYTMKMHVEDIAAEIVALLTSGARRQDAPGTPIADSGRGSPVQVPGTR